jgi:hypothetical protein
MHCASLWCDRDELGTWEALQTLVVGMKRQRRAKQSDIAVASPPRRRLYSTCLERTGNTGNRLILRQRAPMLTMTRRSARWQSITHFVIGAVHYRATRQKFQTAQRSAPFRLFEGRSLSALNSRRWQAPRSMFRESPNPGWLKETLGAASHECAGVDTDPVGKHLRRFGRSVAMHHNLSEIGAARTKRVADP